MVIVQICVGSSCHLKGAPEIVAMMQNEVSQNHLEDEIVLCGSFCAGMCNRVGVTVTVNSTVYTGVTKENFKEFWNENVLKEIVG